MENVENAPPSRTASALPRLNSAAMGARGMGRNLQELSDPQHNSRAQGSSMLPQYGAKRPHAGSASQPEPKIRKTLHERAGECHGARAAATPASSQPPRGNSIASIYGVKPAQVTAARPPSAASRPPPSRGYGQSVGSETRPPHSARPKSFSKSVMGRPPTTADARPATAMESYTTKDEVSVGNRQNGWDVDERLHQVESQFKAIKEVMDGSLTDRKRLEEVMDITKARASDLERERDQLTERSASLQAEVNELRQQSQSLGLALEAAERRHQYAVEDKAREHRREAEDLRKELQVETERLQREYREALEALNRHHRAELDDERLQTTREMQAAKAKLEAEQQDRHLATQQKDRDMQDLWAKVEEVKGDLDREHTMKEKLSKTISELVTKNTALDEQVQTLRGQIHFLESDSKQQSEQFAHMEARMQEALKAAEESRQKLIKEETERRALFNKYQELKGNIRVMCRVRPVLDEKDGDTARMAYPDVKTSTQIEVTGEEERSSLGRVSRKVVPFEFDRVFSPDAQNDEVFGEISQLVQSALDGYNVCIFCYGQTGSGKTYTMSSADGMIPRATHMIYDNITQLAEKSWSYTMEGSFIEVYNEELHDLLSPGRDPDPKRKLEIHHDETRKTTTVVNCKSVRLDSPEGVEAMLREAMGNRAIAATKANERSSRSHCVFMLRLQGDNSATGERCEGTLNLVDLAGSERLKLSGAEGERMRETQNINRSLSCLGDVIEALGEKRGHVPYRNSRLTHLLQYSLGGNSKTLMFVMVSPLEAHLRDTMTSLKFATKVHNTHIGTAKSTKKARESA